MKKSDDGFNKLLHADLWIRFCWLQSHKEKSLNSNFQQLGWIAEHLIKYSLIRFSKTLYNLVVDRTLSLACAD